MHDDTKTKVKDAFRTGNASLITQALFNFYKEQNFYRKPAYTKSPLPVVSSESDNNIIKIANEVFNGDFSESPTTPKETESLQIPMVG